MRKKPRTMVVLGSFVLAWSLSSCTPRSPSTVPLNISLRGEDGRGHQVGKIIGQHKLTVFIFDSEGCPTMAAHRARIASWAKRFLDQGVRFYLVESEKAEPGVVPTEQSRPSQDLLLRYVDSSAQLAQVLRIEFATHAVVFDTRGELVYSGALDSDRVVLHSDAQMYLQETLNDLLAHRAPRYGSPEPLGCVLQLH